MNGRAIVVLAGIATLGWAGNTAAQTRQFTFNVPVQLHNMLIGSTSTGPVMPIANCLAKDGTGGIVGGGTSNITLDPNGNFSGVVTVSFDASTGMDPATASSYSCTLQAYDPARGGLVWSQPADCTSPECTPKAGSTLVARVDGAIP